MNRPNVKSPPGHVRTNITTNTSRGAVTLRKLLALNIAFKYKGWGKRFYMLWCSLKRGIGRKGGRLRDALGRNFNAKEDSVLPQTPPNILYFNIFLFQAGKSHFKEDYYPKKSEAVRSVRFRVTNCNSRNKHEANYFIMTWGWGGRRIVLLAA